MKLKLVSALVVLTFLGCAKTKSFAPLEPEMKQTKSFVTLLDAPPSVVNPSPAVTTEITVPKSQILSRQFLYGATLQFSSLHDDPEDPSALMGLALGQVPVVFQIMDNRLRLVTDITTDFESDINHPARLIYEFPILRQDENSLTFRADQASPVLDTMILGDKSTVAKRASWIRSLEFAPADELFLIQSSVELVDGSLAEFMETLTPREKIVPVDVKPIFNDEALNPQAARFEFIDSGKLFLYVPDHGRVQTAVASRFLPKDGNPILWYVSGNIPEAYVVDVKNSIEAWNRYSRAMGKPDLVRFVGQLPAGIHVGDPRYNVVVWDNMDNAGSAYETQAADPLTGVQSHSLIYLPSAWVTIGKSFWETARHTEAEKPSLIKQFKGRTFMGRPLPINCIDDADMHVSMDSRLNPEQFGHALLKSTLFHEVGHSLGLSHNFKGSTAYDPEVPGTLFSSTIMDYVAYNQTVDAFYTLDGSDGPLLEYDRQIISALYNDGKDIKDTDTVMPVCGDADVAARAGGVDPLCAWYDFSSDPTKQAQRSIALLEQKDAHIGKILSLPKALDSLNAEFPDAATITTPELATAAVTKFTNSMAGIVDLYMGKNGIAYDVTQALKSLYVFREGTIPATFDEDEMRDRAVSSMQRVSNMNKLPEASESEIAKLRTNLSAWLLTTPFLQAKADGDRNSQLDKLLQTYDGALKGREEANYSKLRIRMLTNMKYNADAPLGFYEKNGASIDTETVVVNALEALVATNLGTEERAITERIAAATVLATYAKIPAAQEADARLKESVSVEIRAAKDAIKRESLRKLLAALTW